MLDPSPSTPLPEAVPTIAALQGRAPLGAPARITHDGEEGDLRFAIIPLPAYPTPSNTLERRKTAIGASYSGRLAEGVDLYRQTIQQDGFFDGILRTMAEGILQLPVSFSQGTPEMCSALLNADGTAGDYAAMHPLEECAQIFKDALVGFPGLGQYLLMCWRCGYTDHERVVAELDQGVGGSGTFEVCKRCQARRDERPIGTRELFRLEWRDCRWLDQDPVTFQWYYTGRNGRIPITDGDGEWFMFFTMPRLESWRHGIWIWATLYAIFSRDAQYDAQNTSQVTAPTPVLRATKPVPESARAATEERIRRLGFDNRLVLNGEWIYEIVAAKAEYKDICSEIVNRCSDAFETGLTGNVMGRAARTAFTDAGIYKRTTSERRGAAAGLWMRQVGEKGLAHWGLDNYNTRKVPVGEIDVRSPEDKLANAKYLSETGEGIKALFEGLKSAGVRPTTAWVQEAMQQAGIRVEAIPAGPAPNEGGAPAAPAPAFAGQLAAPIGLALSAREVEDDEFDDDDAARLASEMSEHGVIECPHGKKNRCHICGIRAVRSVIPGVGGNPHGWNVAWRAIPWRAPATAQEAA